MDMPGLSHVLDKKGTATVWVNGQRFVTDVIARDEEKDLALLKVKEPEGFSAPPLQLAADADIVMGQDVYTIGFPLSNILGNAPRLNKGLVSSTVGMKDAPDQLQVSVETQPGNSGSPLLDANGRAIGVMHQTLNPWSVFYQSGGNLPQNVNFARKTSVIKEFLGKQNVVPPAEGGALKPLSFDQAKNSVVRVHSGIVTAEELEQPKLVCMFQYGYFWDMWYRFNFLNIDFYDLETGEHLLRAGQYGDNPFSTEDGVLKKTFEEIRQKLAVVAKEEDGK